MNDNLLNFDYNGCTIPFALTENDVMINATEMIKSYPKKRINDFLSNQQTKDLIRVLESETGIPASQLVVVVKGNYSTGIKQGTWMHRKVAIAFAMWLSPVFYSWCLGKLDEIINNGFAFRDSEIERLNNIISGNQPKVDYYDQVLTTSDNLYTMRDICSEGRFKVSYREIYNLLEKEGYIYYTYSQDGKKRSWNLKDPYSKEGYIKSVTIMDKNNKPRTVKRWTEEGRHWIYSLSKKLGILWII